MIHVATSWSGRRQHARPVGAHPDAADHAEDGIIPATVVFIEPGYYHIRGLADDGALTGFDDITVTVTK